MWKAYWSYTKVLSKVKQLDWQQYVIWLTLLSYDCGQNCCIIKSTFAWSTAWLHCCMIDSSVTWPKALLHNQKCCWLIDTTVTWLKFLSHDKQCNSWLTALSHEWCCCHMIVNSTAKWLTALWHDWHWCCKIHSAVAFLIALLYDLQPRHKIHITYTIHKWMSSSFCTSCVVLWISWRAGEDRNCSNMGYHHIIQMSLLEIGLLFSYFERVCLTWLELTTSDEAKRGRKMSCPHFRSIQPWTYIGEAWRDFFPRCLG